MNRIKDHVRVLKTRDDAEELKEAAIKVYRLVDSKNCTKKVFNEEDW